MSNLLRQVVIWIFRNLFAHPDNIRFATQRPLIRKYLKPSQRTIDIGCGRGRYTRLLCERAEFTVGMDVDQYGLQRIRNKGIECSLVQGSAENLPFKASSFDFVLCSEVLEHLNNDKRAVEEMYRILTSKGGTLITVPCPPPVYPDSEHKRVGYTREQIISLLRQSDFEVTSVKFCMFSLSRMLLKFSSIFINIFHFPPPILPVVKSENLFVKEKGISHNPFDIIVEVRKV